MNLLPMAMAGAAIASAMSSVLSNKVRESEVISALIGSKRANELDGLGSQQDGDSVLPANAEVEREHADTEQCGQHSDLVVAGIGQSGYQFHARC
jgi:hypothetical protein